MKIKDLKETVRFKNLRVRTLTGEEGWYVSKSTSPKGKMTVTLIPEIGSNKTVELNFASAEALLGEIFEWEILDTMKKNNICEVCKEGISLGIVASRLGPISYCICSDCMSAGAEPDYIVLNIVETLGWDLQKLAEWAHDSLIFYDKEKKEYIDVKKADIKYLKTLSAHKVNDDNKKDN